MGKTVRKILAVFSSAAMLLTCGATGTMPFLTSGTAVQAAARTTATQLRILDESGNDMGDYPIIYVDNSEAGGAESEYHQLTKTIKVIASDNNGNPVEDEIRFFAEAGSSKYIHVTCPEVGTEQITARIGGGYWEESGKEGEDPTWVSKEAGTTHLQFTTSSGEVYRSVTVVTYNPATDMKVYYNSKLNLLDLNDYNYYNTTNIMAIANHKYQFYTEKVPTNTTDEVEWQVYDGYYDGSTAGIPTTKAEITSKGLFTPKVNGSVTLVAKYKATETTDRAHNYGPKKMKVADPETGDIRDEDVLTENVPKYIHVTIVKDNPAKSLMITNAPDAMEINDTAQLKYEATPTYTGAGYETGATDRFTWRSSNTQVATVDNKGLVTAVGKGDTKITIFAENQNVYSEVNIKVLTKATSISFPVITTSTRVGVTTLLKAIMNPITADDEIEWTSSDESIATVEAIHEEQFTSEQSVAITGRKTGTVIITAKAKNSGVEAKITCNVEEKIDSADIKLTIPNGSEIITLYDNSSISVYDQKTITINGSLVAADGSAPDDHLNWEVIGNGENNGDYVTIEDQTPQYIQLKGFARGTVMIKASSNANPSLSKTIELRVLKRATKGSIVDNDTRSKSFHKYLNVGSEAFLAGDIMVDTNQPYDHDDHVVSWRSSNEQAFVITYENETDGNKIGHVKAVGNGSASITMVTASGFKVSTSLTAFTTSSVVIKNVTTYTDGSLPSTDLALNKDNYATKNLSATVKNQNDAGVTDSALLWTSDNEEVATVDQKGVVTGHRIGSTNITVKSGNKTDTAIVNVRYPITNAVVTIDTVYYSPFVTEYEPQPVVTTGETNAEERITLVKDQDYSVSYSNNTTTGQTATVTITGLGDYTGTITKNFRILPRPITDAEISIEEIANQELTEANLSTGVIPELTITHSGYPLTLTTDYTTTFAKNKIVGVDASVTIKGVGNYTGSTMKNFTIFCRHTGTFTDKTTVQPTCIKTGVLQHKCNVCGHIDEETLPLVDHKFSKTKTVAPTYDEDGYSIYTCSVCRATENRDFVPALEKMELSKCTITVDKTLFTVSTAIQKPKITIKNGDTTLRENTDYKLEYSDASSKDPGNYTVNIIGIKGYRGEHLVKYQILPLAESITLNLTQTEMIVGKTLALKATTTPAEAINTLKWVSSNASVATVDEKGVVTAVKAGTVIITCSSGSAKATCSITVNTPLENTSRLSSEAIFIGENVNVIGESTGGIGEKQFQIYYKKSTSTKWTLAKDYSKISTVSIKPKYTGKYTVCIRVKDAKGTVKQLNLVVTVKPSDLLNTSSLSSETLTLTKAVTINASAEQGKAPYKFAVYYKASGSTKWTKKSDYTTTTSFSFKPGYAKTYTVRVKAKDSLGNIKNKDLTLTVKVSNLTNTSKLAATTITKGQSVTVNCSSTGGNGNKVYSVLYKPKTSTSWTKVRDYEAGTSVAVTPKKSGEYTIRVNVKDDDGIIRRKDLSVTVKLSNLKNTSTLSSTAIKKGESVTVRCSCTGAVGTPKYAVYYKAATQSKWTTARAYQTGTSVTVKPNYAVEYTIRVAVKDDSGTIVRKDIVVNVTK